MYLNLAQRFRLIDKPEMFYQFQEDDGTTRDLTLKDVLLANLRAIPSKERSSKETKKRFWAIKKIKKSDKTINLEAKHIAFLIDCISPNSQPDIYGLAVAMLDGYDLDSLEDFNLYIADDLILAENNLFE
jgi:hypothetical protein